MKLNFAEWLKKEECGTSTASIAGFARPIFPDVVRRVVNEKKKHRKKN